MPIIPMELPEGYELQKDFMGRKFALIFREFSYIWLVAEWKESPFPEEVLIAASRRQTRTLIKR